MHDNNAKTQLISDVKNALQTPVWLMPLNYHEQKELFLAGEIENPQFIYPEIPIETLTHWLQKLEAIDTSHQDDLELYFIHRQIEELKLKLQILIHRDSVDYFAYVQQLYPCHFDKSTITHAQTDVMFSSLPNHDEIVDVTQFFQILRDYLEKTYQVTDWEIQIIERNDFTVKIQPRYKKIFVSSSLKQKQSSVDLLLAHEIDGHLVRGLNMHQQQGYLGRQFPFYLKTEEGIACFLQDYCTVGGAVSRKKHAAKYLAGISAKTSGFNSVNEQLIGFGLSSKLAFKRTFRLKRGISDTSKLGLFSKEAMYYEGMMQVKQIIDQNGDIQKLFAGKIGLADLVKIDNYTAGVIPSRLQKYQYDQY